MKHLRMKAMLLIGVSLLVFSGVPAAAVHKDMYQGELTSGNTDTGRLESDEIWMFHGNKDGHIVITTAANQGIAPPEIFLYPPDGRQYEAHSRIISSRSQVLDYRLEESGRYEVLVHPCATGDPSSYRIAYSLLNPGDVYRINPDNPDNLLNVYTRDHKMFVDRSDGLLPASIVFDVATFGIGPIIFDAFTVLDRVIVGAERYDDRVVIASRSLDLPQAQCEIAGR